MRSRSALPPAIRSRHRLSGSASSSAPAPLSSRDIDALQVLLDLVPAPLEPLDVVMLDGYLCGVLVQPERVPPARWWRYVTDVDGRALPPGFDASRLRALVERRHAELDRAIAARKWFDPWVFELDEPPSAAPIAVGGGAGSGKAPSNDAGSKREDDEGGRFEAVYPWVAGFAAAQEHFPALMALPPESTLEPLALLYRHLDPEDLEDADDLLAEIDALEPPADLADAVEGLVRATLLLADASRPLGNPR